MTPSQPVRQAHPMANGDDFVIYLHTRSRRALAEHHEYSQRPLIRLRWAAAGAVISFWTIVALTVYGLLG